MKKTIQLTFVFISCFTISACSTLSSNSLNDCSFIYEANVEGHKTGIYEAYGLGDTVEHARVNAQQSLARQINTHVSHACQEQTVELNVKLSSKAGCRSRQRSKARFSILPIVEQGMCQNKHYVKLRSDTRPITEKLSLQHMAKANSPNKLPFSVLSNQKSNSGLNTFFSIDTRLWTIKHKNTMAYEEHQRFYKQIDWSHECTGELDFSLKKLGRIVSSAVEGEVIYGKLSTYNTNQYISFINILESGESTLLMGRSFTQKEFDSNSSVRIDLSLPSHQHSSPEAYLVLLSSEPLEARLTRTYLHPAQQLSSLIKLIQSPLISEYCYQGITVYRRGI